MNPSSWGRYQAIVPPGDPSRSDASRLAARYRMATDLESVTFRSLATSTGDGYAAGLSVGLAYSALESFERLASESRNPEKFVVVKDEEVASQLRSPRSAKRVAFLQAENENKRLHRRIADFMDDPTDVDVRPVAEKIRHLVFHGAFTPHGAGAITKTARGTLNALADAVQKSADSHFTLWVVANQGQDS